MAEEIVPVRPPETQLDHLRQLSRHSRTLPEGATASQVRNTFGWSTELDLVPARSFVARRPELFVVDEDELVHIRVKCRCCREDALLPLMPDMDDWPAGVPVKINVIARFAVWVAQRWCCELCSLKEVEAQSRKGADAELGVRLRASGIPKSMIDAVSWRSMIEKGSNDDETKKRIRAIQVAKEWAAKEKPKHALLIYGDPGTGKTRLAATAAVARAQQWPIQWVSVAVLMARLDAAWSDADRHAALRVMTGKGPVVLDDIDKLNTSSSRTTMHLFTAIDRREQAGEHAVIFTANGTPKELAAALGDALFSRVTGMCHSNAGVLPFPGPDRRLEIGEAQSEQSAAVADSWGL